MRLIKPSVEIWEQPPGMSGIYQQIERCARVCYKSEDKIGEGTAEKMVKMLEEREHTAMLEHGTVYLTIPKNETLAWEEYLYDTHARVNFDRAFAYVTTNYRTLYENDLLEDLQYQTEPMEGHEKRVTVHFTCDRGISHELVRHRVFSFAQESTRYCNYSKDKFGNELTFIIPCWIDAIPNNSSYDYDTNIDGWQKSEDANTSNFLQSLARSEKNYLTLLRNRWTPQQARTTLPNSLKTEVCMTGFVSDWEYFFGLRTAQNAHPQMRELTIPLKDIFKNKGLL